MVTDDNGLYYMRARYYNPEIKRFINQDILTGNIGNHKSLNRYSYVQGNPVSYTDPFGLSPFSYISEPIHSVLSMAGCIPVIGNFFDGLNSVVYLMEGDTAKAVLNLTSLIPGDKLGKYVVKNGRKIATVTALTAVICQTDAGAGLKRGLTDAGNEIVEFYGLDDMSAMDYLFMGIYGFRFAKGAKGGLLDIDLPNSNKAPEVEIAGTGVTVKADSFDDVLYRADDAAPANVNKGGVGFDADGNDKFETPIYTGTSKPWDSGATQNSIYEQLNPNGTVKSRAFYDDYGRQFNRQDFDHEHFDKLTQQYYQPHEHSYHYNEPSSVG